MIIHPEPPGSSRGELIQIRGKTSTRFTIKSRNELEIETSSKNSGKVVPIELKLVSETPSRQRFQAGYIDPSVILCGAVALVFVISAILALNGDFPGLAIAFLVLSFPGVLFGVIRSRRLRATSYDIFIFENRFGGVAFVIEANKPDEQSFESFLNHLKNTIRSVSPDPVSMSSGEVLSGQVAKLHDLFQQGLLTETEFVAAKERLLNRNATVERRIGFEAR